jgi:sugar phosphate permease
MVATTPLVVLVEQLGWRDAFHLIGALHFLLTLFFYIIVRDRPLQQPASRAEPATRTIDIRQAFDNIRILLKQKDYWFISLATFARYGIYAAFQALWAGPFLLEVMGCSILTTGNLILLLNVGMILGAPFWGALSDRLFKTRKWLIISGSISITLTVIILTAISPATPLPVLALLFFCFGFFNATGLLMYPHIKELMPLEMSGSAMTGINFFTMIGPAVFLQGLGSLMQTFYPQESRGPDAFKTAFLICVICLLIVTMLYVFTKERPSEKNSKE